MSGGWILDGKTAVHCEDIIEWAQWFEKGNRRVAETDIGGVKISTVFLGLDHQFGQGLPLLFETMVFDRRKQPDKEIDEHTERYATWDEAEVGHKIVVALVRESIG